MNEGIEIRRDLRPGDLEAIVAQHGRLYSREYGNDSSFEEMVAASVARAEADGFPREREGIWIVEREGAHLGSIALTDDGDGAAVVRWVLLDPSLRGRGIGRRLVDEAMAEARRHGYRRVRLQTFSDLNVAAHLYRDHGFEVVREDTGPRWGRAEVTYQYYEVELAGGTSGIEARGLAAQPG
jgi:ribosomal protein S18 acetylase RimI-like enzyme